jgi:hypothetical protein
MQDCTEDGRRFRMLTVIDEYTRRCPAIVVARKLNSDDVHENDVCSLVAKAIQKLKKAVLREIEFEDGRSRGSMGWSSTDRGPSIDRRAIR